ncbi:hypothetical protein M569_08745 [Genlisea aurea]|uniref:pyridoxal 5'-phosphate synthase n=1 Tax=Genlisea aurea TaxID=192259 RepID=S8E168_9LAMI|nr:hypothetical protein M569_08745 [Genlisea aurea]
MSSSVGTPWKQLLLCSIQANSRLNHSSYLQLATVSANDRPSNRTVVFRGFMDDTDKILIHSDIRTRKIDDLKHSPFAEICWYFSDTWEQFRISGRVEVIDGTNTDPSKLEQRASSWFASSLKSRLQYTSPAPGIPLSSQQPLLDDRAGPAPAFCLLVFDPHEVDYLNLKSSKRVMFSSGSNIWTSEEVSP